MATSEAMSSTTNTTENSSNVQRRCWDDVIDPELRSAFRGAKMVPTFTPFKARLFHLLMKIPQPLPSNACQISKSGKARSRKVVDVHYEDVPVGRYFRPAAADDAADEKKSRAAILWIHGGGRMMGNSRVDTAACVRLATELKVHILSVEHLLAPAHPFPAPLDDCLAGWDWLVSRAKEDGLDMNRIAVAGESAGGGLAAELCQRLLDRSREAATAAKDEEEKVVLPACQVLVYPMLDDRTVLHEGKTLAKHPVWNNTSKLYGWSSYLGPECKPGDPTLPDYAAASRREDLSGLPPAWIMAGEADLFLEEDREYAERLRKDNGGVDGYDCKFVEVKGGFHAMLNMAPDAKPMLRVWDDMFDFLRKWLQLN